MPVVLSVGPRSTDSTESTLQHFYFIAVIVIVFALAILRILVLRRRNQALSNFFRMGSGSQYPYGSYPPQDGSHGSMFHGLQLAPPPAAYRPDRRVCAADVDAQGRRLGPAGEDWEGKDALPAYDNLDRPPKYIEASWSHSRPAEQSAMTSPPAGEQSGIAHSDIANGDIGNNVQPHDDTHADAVHGSEAPPPPPSHNDMSTS